MKQFRSHSRVLRTDSVPVLAQLCLSNLETITREPDCGKEKAMRGMDTCYACRRFQVLVTGVSYSARRQDGQRSAEQSLSREQPRDHLGKRQTNTSSPAVGRSNLAVLLLPARPLGRYFKTRSKICPLRPEPAWNVVADMFEIYNSRSFFFL